MASIAHFQRSAWTILLALGSVAFTTHSQAQDSSANWPTKAIKVTVPYTPGGSTDIVSRTVFDAVSKRLGQPVIIENKPGANSTIGVAQTARAPADGYHFVSMLAAYTVNMSLYKKLPYKASDFVAVSHVADLPMFLFAANKLPVKNAKELAEYGKKNPLNYASSGTGASAHMIGARWAQENGLNAQHVPYNGSAPILADLMSGQVDMLFDPALVPMPHAKSGKIKVLAVASKQRWPGEPDIPTMEEAGFPGFVMNSWVGVLAPKGTPQPIVDKLSSAIAEAAQSPEVKTKLTQLGFGAVGSTPEQFQQLIDQDTAMYKGVIDKAQVSID
ncbi:Bug family tripartite tricarboxylate transporter substrate binding protein [Comamonas jiangduensis]|uniref:Bug family tripartite tricarboxylate transporter substrate binding protein n=1 Tax=Comamonas jiangduensis TaxID=1194168 RepID=UPI0028A828D1|nr:tripartite tricarboxylate transporter substrate binding protein [Comamonas jiangduensis]